MTPGRSSDQSRQPQVPVTGTLSVRPSSRARDAGESITGSFRLRHLLVVFSLPENWQPEYATMATVEQARRATASDLIDVGSTIVTATIGVNPGLPTPEGSVRRRLDGELGWPPQNSDRNLRTGERI